jgi:hypothetical protein
MITVPRSVAVTPSTQEQVEKVSRVAQRIIAVLSVALFIACVVAIYVLLLNSY